MKEPEYILYLQSLDMQNERVAFCVDWYHKTMPQVSILQIAHWKSKISPEILKFHTITDNNKVVFDREQQPNE